MKKQVFSLSALGLFLGLGGLLYAQKTDSLKTKELEAVVIKGVYGIKQSAEQVSGSSTKISKTALESPTGVSVDNLLQGSGPGIMSSAGSGQPGAKAITLIRGISSLTSGNSPLYIIDGVPVASGDISRNTATQNALSLINPNDIEDIQVYKDGVATSLFGSRGANGVVVITTKSGKKGTARINLTTEIGTSAVAYDKFEYLNAEEHVKYTALAYFNSDNLRNASKEFNGDFSKAYTKAVNFFRWDGKTNTDWQRAALRENPAYSRYNVSISGGAKDVTLYASLGYLSQEGVPRNADFQRYTGALKGTWQASDKLKASFSLNLSRSVQNTPSTNLTFANPMFMARAISPTQRIYNADGTYNTNIVSVNPNFNIIAVQDLNLNKAVFDKVLSSLSLDYDILPYLTFNTSFGIDNNSGDELVYWNPDIGDGYEPSSANGNGALSKSFTKHFTWNWYNFLNFNKRFGAHNVSATVGIEATKRTIDIADFEASGFPSGIYKPYASLAASPTAASSNRISWGLVGYIARASYTYDKFLTLTASARRDGYSGFSDYYGNFYGVGGNLELSRIDAVKNVFKSLKLKASYGENGNMAVGPYTKLKLYRLGFNYDSSNGAALSQTGAPDEGLKWEVSKKTNIGLDFSLGRRGSVYGTLDFYSNTNSDQIFDEQVPLTTGFSSVTRNLASVRSRGVEASLGANLVKQKDFQWNVNANYSYNDSEILSLSSDNGTGISQIDGRKAFEVGRNPSEFYMRLWVGVDPNTGQPLWYTDGTKTAVTSNSNLAQLSFTGKKALPTHIAALNNELVYKNFRLVFNINYQGGFSVYDAGSFVTDTSGTFFIMNKVKEDLYDSWTPKHTNASRPEILANGNNGDNGASSRYLYDGDFIRLRSLELGYRLNQEQLNLKGLKSVYLYVRGTNLLTYVFDKDLKFDPESNSNSYSNTISNLGIYNSLQPQMKQFIFGVSLDF